LEKKYARNNKEKKYVHLAIRDYVEYLFFYVHDGINDKEYFTSIPYFYFAWEWYSVYLFFSDKNIIIK